MINTTMPIASPHLTVMLDEDSPSLIPDHTKSFFDYADVADPAVTALYHQLDYKPESDAVVPSHFVLDECSIPMEHLDTNYGAQNSRVIVNVVDGDGGGVVEMEMEVPASALIPTTALEMAGDGELELAQPDMNASFLNPNLPAPLGSQPPTPCPPPATSSPFSPTVYPHPPSTPSCHSSCSDDVASCMSDVSTPGVSGVTSGDHFVIPLPADDTMAAATLTALETCSLTPLIKEELKYTIQSRRLAAGKPELVVDNRPPVKPKKVMTSEERERALKRREQNRMAAQRFRQKQKDTADVFIRKCHKLDGANAKLRAEIKRLAEESQELRQLLTSHLLVCPKAVKVTR